VLLNFIYLCILALAVSLDSFGVGVTYGLRKVKLPLISIIIIGLASAIMILISMQIGVWISLMLSPSTAKWIGSIILVLIGIWAIHQVLKSDQEVEIDNKKKLNNKGKRIVYIEIKKLGVVIEILKKPIKADIDNSGYISAAEATLLGLALSIDAFGAGIGAALVGFNPLITAATIAGMSSLFILLGLKMGFWFSGIEWLKKFTVLPGIILILIGILKAL